MHNSPADRRKRIAHKWLWKDDMKPLNELIDGLENYKDRLEESGVDTSGLYYLHTDMYAKGYRECFDLLAPALKEAIRTIEDLSEALVREKAFGLYTKEYTEENLESVRVILEGRDE